jgi:hypothetical protein
MLCRLFDFVITSGFRFFETLENQVIKSFQKMVLGSSEKNSMNLQISWKKLQIRVGPLTNSFVFSQNCKFTGLNLKHQIWSNQIFDHLWFLITYPRPYPPVPRFFYVFRIEEHLVPGFWKFSKNQKQVGWRMSQWIRASIGGISLIFKKLQFTG